MGDLKNRFGPGLSTIFLILVLFWLAVMVLAPNLMMIDYALRPNLPPAALGGPDDTYTLSNILYLAGEPTHRAIFFKTIWASGLVAAVTFAVCYPIAFWMAQRATTGQLAIAMMLFVLATPLARAHGRTGTMVVTRLLGMLLAALSVQFVIDGLRGSGLFG